MSYEYIKIVSKHFLAVSVKWDCESYGCRQVDKVLRGFAACDRIRKERLDRHISPRYH